MSMSGRLQIVSESLGRTFGMELKEVGESTLILEAKLISDLAHGLCRGLQ